MSQSIVYVNRVTGKQEVEKVYGDALIRFAYQNAVGAWLTEHLLSKKWLSDLYGRLQDGPRSTAKIAGFVEQFGIQMDDFVDPGFKSFNEFFIRKFKEGKRPFESDPKRMAAPAEARYLAWESIQPDQLFPVKGKFLSANALLGGHPLASEFENGPLMIARLCPVDYHRFHFPDSGRLLEDFRLVGKYHSVNPIALQAQGDIFCTNERHVSILETENFGRLAYIEVGALCVGKIVQSYRGVAGDALAFERGDEKGYFLFGGSTVILLGQAGRWTPDTDLLEATSRGVETWLPLGQGIARGGG